MRSCNSLVITVIVLLFSGKGVCAQGQEPPPAGLLAWVNDKDPCGNIHFVLEQPPLPVTWLAVWEVSGFQSFASNDTFVRIKKAGIHSYKIKLTNGLDTIEQLGVFVSQYEPNMVFASHQLSDCSVASFNFTYTNQSHLPQQIRWHGDDMFTSDELQPVHNYSHPGRFKYTCTMISAFFCDTSVYEGQVNVVNTTTAFAGVDLAVCSDDQPFVLVGHPAGGIWSGTGLKNGNFDPAKAGEGKHTLTYRYQLNGCPASDQVVIDVHRVTAEFTEGITEGYVPFTVPFHDNSSGNISSRTWNFGDPASAGLNTSDAENPFHTYTEPGTYTVSLETRDDETGCQQLQQKQALVRAKKEVVISKQFEHKLNFAPNPANGAFTLEIDLNPNETYSLQVFDALGRCLLQYSNQNSNKLTLLETSTAGAVYFVQVQSSDGTNYTGRFVVLH